MKEKNRLFAVMIVFTVIFLAILWNREQVTRARLKRMDEMMMKLETRIHLLRLKAEVLKEEIEMLNLYNIVKIAKEDEKKEKEKKENQEKKNPNKPGNRQQKNERRQK